MRHAKANAAMYEGQFSQGSAADSLYICKRSVGRWADGNNPAGRPRTILDAVVSPASAALESSSKLFIFYPLAALQLPSNLAAALCYFADTSVAQEEISRMNVSSSGVRRSTIAVLGVEWGCWGRGYVVRHEICSD